MRFKNFYYFASSLNIVFILYLYWLNCVIVYFYSNLFWLIQWINSISMLHSAFFDSFDPFFFFPFSISPWFDLNLIWSFFDLARLIWASFIFSKTLKSLSNSSNFTSVIGPFYQYINLSVLTLLSNSVIFSSLLSASLLNIYFCFEIHGLSLSV